MVSYGMLFQNQRVVCIDDNFPAYARATYTDLPKKDEIYTIRDVGMGLDAKAVVKSSTIPLSFTGTPDLMVLLKEIKNPIHEGSKLEMGFLAKRFAPLVPLTEEEILMQNAPAPKPKVIEKPKKKKKIKVRELQPV